MIIIYTVIRRRRRNKSQTGSPWKRAPLYTPEQCHGRIRCVEATPRMISMSAPYTMYINVYVCVCMFVSHNVRRAGVIIILLLLLLYYYYCSSSIKPLLRRSDDRNRCTPRFSTVMWKTDCLDHRVSSTGSRTAVERVQ